MTTDETLHLVSRLSEVADDFFYDILLLKSMDFTNSSIPFLHGHVLELSAKVACHKLKVDFSNVKNGHNVLEILELLKTKIPAIDPLIPSSASFEEYKDIWLPGNSSNSNVMLPPPKEMDELELAYIMDNVMDLKYGFKKNYSQVSKIDICHEAINQNFLQIFNLCRQTYMDDNLNNRIKEKIYKVFGKNEGTDKRMYDLLKI